MQRILKTCTNQSPLRAGDGLFPLPLLPRHTPPLRRQIEFATVGDSVKYNQQICAHLRRHYNLFASVTFIEFEVLMKQELDDNRVPHSEVDTMLSENHENPSHCTYIGSHDTSSMLRFVKPIAPLSSTWWGLRIPDMITKLTWDREDDDAFGCLVNACSFLIVSREEYDTEVILRDRRDRAHILRQQWMAKFNTTDTQK